MSKPKLLLADDSITIQKVVNLTFADQGMDVVAFSDGDAAIEHFDTVKPDIVLADVHMPGINGYQLCELLRSDNASSTIPIVLLVGSFEPFDREEADRVGASGYLTKPFSSIAELVSTVENLLAKSPTAEPEPETAVADGPKPDTTDIDNLYEQSFVETVEIPREEAEELEFDEVGLDDEMIQTSYGEPDLGDDIDSSYYTEEVGAAPDAAEDTAHESESLIAESVPVEIPSAEAVPDEAISYESVSEEVPGYEPEPEEIPSAETADQEPEIQAASGPFDSIAADLPPIESASPATFDAGDDTGLDEADLLELPVAPRSQLPDNGALNERPREITSLSPELIDLIVEKVVARLAEKQSSAAGE